MKTVESVREWRGRNFWQNMEDLVGLQEQKDSFAFQTDMPTDPAETDPELSAKLAANKAIGTKRMAQVLFFKKFKSHKYIYI